METFIGILVIALALGAVWYFVKRRNRYHDTHPKDESGGGTGGKGGGRPDKH